ncbi:hypothetical protein BN1723_018568, partial [Verticillium longisporum]
PKSLTVPRLRSILVAHDVQYPATAKKPQLIDIFNEGVVPKAKKFLDKQARAKRSSMGIINMPRGDSYDTASFDDEDTDPDSAALASVALTRVFVRLLAAGSLIKKKGLTEKDTVVVGWLRERYFEYKDVLAELITDEELGSPALTLAMRMLKSEAQHLYESDEFNFPQAFLQQIIKALLNSSSDDARGDFVDKYLTEF